MRWSLIFCYYVLSAVMALIISKNGEVYIWFEAIFITLFWATPWLLMLHVRSLIDG